MKKYCMAALFFIVSNNLFSQVIPTNDWISFYSDNCIFNNEKLHAGDVVEAFDSDSVLCGRFIVRTEGFMGYLQVYADDFTTTDIDEGAEAGDTIWFKINNSFTKVIGDNLPIWIGNKEIINITLVSKSNWEPVLVDIPNQAILEGEVFKDISLDNYVQDYDNSKEELIWTFTGNMDLEVKITTGRTAIVEIPDSNWFGEEDITFSVSDPHGESAGKQVRFTVENINDSPQILNLPDSITFYADSIVTLSLNEYVYDIDDNFFDLKIDITSSSDSIITNYVENTGILKISSINTFSGSSELLLQVADDHEAEAVDVIDLNVVNMLTGIKNMDNESIPKEFTLLQNYPNPFNPVTTINYQLPVNCHVTLKVFNVLGSEVAVLINAYEAAGYHGITFNAVNLPSGVYFYRLEAGSFNDIKKIILLK